MLNRITPRRHRLLRIGAFVVLNPVDQPLKVLGSLSRQPLNGSEHCLGSTLAWPLMNRITQSTA